MLRISDLFRVWTPIHVKFGRHAAEKACNYYSGVRRSYKAAFEWGPIHICRPDPYHLPIRFFTIHVGRHQGGSSLHNMDKSIFTPQDFAGGDFGGFPVGRPDSKGHYAAGHQHRDNTFPIDTTWSTSPFNTHFGPLDQNLPFTEASYPSLLPASAMLVGPNMSGYVQDPMAWAHSQQPMISGTTLSTIPIAPEVQSGIHGDFSRSGLDISLSESQPSSFDTNLLYPSSNSGWNASVSKSYVVNCT